MASRRCYKAAPGDACVHNGPQPPGEGSPRRSGHEEKQVGLTRAVRRPESGQWDGRTPHHAEALRPLAEVLPRASSDGLAPRKDCRLQDHALVDHVDRQVATADTSRNVVGFLQEGIESGPRPDTPRKLPASRAERELAYVTANRRHQVQPLMLEAHCHLTKPDCQCQSTPHIGLTGSLQTGENGSLLRHQIQAGDHQESLPKRPGPDGT